MNPTQRTAVEATLANDEVSTDEELLEYFQREIGLTKREAESALRFRDKWLKGEIR